MVIFPDMTAPEAYLSKKKPDPAYGTILLLTAGFNGKGLFVLKLKQNGAFWPFDASLTLYRTIN